jgi:SM-20-related protein
MFVRDGVLDGPAVERARQELAALAARARPAGMGSGNPRQDGAERGDRILWLDDDAGGPGLQALRRVFDGLELALQRDARLRLGRREVQVAWYPGGGARYARHRDVFRHAAAGPRRRVTAIVYLNPGWRPEDGGLLRLHVGQAPVDVAPAAGRLVVFLSERVEHEVLQARASRLAVTAWLYEP